MINDAETLMCVQKIGAFICKMADSQLGKIVGPGVPVTAGLQALQDLIRKQVRFRPYPSTRSAGIDSNSELWRRRVMRLWFSIVGIALLDVVLLTWVFVIEDIPKDHLISMPTIFQSMLLIFVVMVMLVYAAIAAFQLFATAKLAGFRAQADSK
jgi:hypothetical protein